jgi:hypothetical protein
VSSAPSTGVRSFELDGCAVRPHADEYVGGLGRKGWLAAAVHPSDPDRWGNAGGRSGPCSWGGGQTRAPKVKSSICDSHATWRRTTPFVGDCGLGGKAIVGALASRRRGVSQTRVTYLPPVSDSDHFDRNRAKVAGLNQRPDKLAIFCRRTCHMARHGSISPSEPKKAAPPNR